MGKELSIYTRAQELAEEMSGRWKDFFMSDAVYEAIRRRLALVVKGCYQSMVRDGARIAPSLIETDVNKMMLSLIYDPGHEVKTACCISTGHSFQIIINGTSPLITMGDSVEQKYELAVASGIHEVAHRLFTDFVALRARNLQMLNGKWFPIPPQNIVTADGVMLQQMLNDANFCQAFAEFLDAVSNGVEDGYIEWAISSRYPGQIAELLKMRRPLAIEQSHSVTDYYNLPDKDKVPYQLLVNLVIMYAKFQTIKWGEMSPQELAAVMPREMGILFDCLDLIDEAVVNDSPIERIQCINNIGVLISPLFIEFFSNLPEPQKQNSAQSQGQQILQQALQNAGVEMLNSLAGGQGNNTVGHSNPALPENATVMKNSSNTSSGGSGGAGDRGNANGGPATSNSYVSPFSSDVKNIFREMAANQIHQEMEQERKKALQESAERYAAEYGESVEVPDIDRTVTVPAEFRDRYNEISGANGGDRTLSVAKRLGKLVAQKLWEDKNNGFSKSYFGQKFSGKQYTVDPLRCFQKKNVPVKAPNLAVFVLIDESGSVTNELNLAEMRAAIVMEAFCKEAGVPLCIYGYRSSGGAQLRSYVEFDRIDGNDKYRLMGISSGGGTPTVAAMVYAAGRLRECPEEKKLLLVITDGGAGDDDSQGTNTKHLISQVHAKSRINVLAFGIGSDKQSVCDQFGKDRYVGIDEMQTFPERLVTTIRKNMVGGGAF